MGHISEDIRMKRLKLKKSIKDTASGSGLSVNTYKKAESGDNSISLDNLISICEFLDYTLKLELTKKK